MRSVNMNTKRTCDVWTV